MSIRKGTRPIKDKERGTFLIDRVFRIRGRPVRIKKASGTRDTKQWRLMNAMLDTLHQGGRHDVLEQIAGGKLKVLEAWRHYQRGEWQSIPRDHDAKPLGPTLKEWAQTHPGSDGYRADMVAAFERLAALGKPTDTIGQLVERLEDYQALCLETGAASSFNHTRSYVQAVVKRKMSRSSQTWIRVADLGKLDVSKKFKRRPLSPDEARETCANLRENAAAIVWGMCVTGMNPKEYWGEWSVREGRVLIHGTKRAGRERVIPLIERPTRPALTREGFKTALQRADDVDLRPYDCRRTYANWLEAAGIPRTRRRLYMGHGAKDVTDLYEAHDVTRHLKDDGEKLRAYVGVNQSRKLKMVK